jgi:xylose isomerase
MVASAYGHTIGFEGTFLVNWEPMKHQHAFDAQTEIGSLRYQDLDRDFWGIL